MIDVDDRKHGSVALRLMPAQSLPDAESRLPTRWEAILFAGKAWCFRIRRWFHNGFGRRPLRLKRKPLAAAAPAIALSQSPLFPSDVPAERLLQAGKVQNLRVAARYLDGLVIPAGAIFSFWAQMPRPRRRLGFVQGRELREGCVIASVGGGLCQLSNALYDAALKAGCDIVERHAHSRRIEGSMAAQDRDATIFWNYVDLRFRPPVDCQLQVALDRDELKVTLRRLGSPARTSPPVSRKALPAGPGADLSAASCETCGVVTCFRHESAASRESATSTAWLVDGWWPEFDGYLRENAAPADWLFTPLNSRRLRIGPYHWSSGGFAAVRQAPWLVVSRSLQSRRLAAQGAQRQRALLRMDEALARHYARRLPFTATHLVISQTLLPFLWRDGVLGGRSFDVLMTRLPLEALQTTLDRAAQAWPMSPTLADFRAEPSLLAAEREALAAARYWITPHSKIAKLAGAKARKLDWHIPPVVSRNANDGAVFFPAGTLGRKGAYELREVARDLDLTLALGGGILEDNEFWNGVPVISTRGDPLATASLVVLPAWIEDQPRRLLRAAGAGITVIASDACGLEGVPGVTTVPAGDVPALRNAIIDATQS
jgi:hypothetical protein